MSAADGVRAASNAADQTSEPPPAPAGPEPSTARCSAASVVALTCRQPAGTSKKTWLGTLPTNRYADAPHPATAAAAAGAASCPLRVCDRSRQSTRYERRDRVPGGIAGTLPRVLGNLWSSVEKQGCVR